MQVKIVQAAMMTMTILIDVSCLAPIDVPSNDRGRGGLDSRTCSS